MPGRSAANRMRQCANAKTVTTSFVRVYPLVALQCGPQGIGRRDGEREATKIRHLPESETVSSRPPPRRTGDKESFAAPQIKLQRPYAICNRCLFVQVFLKHETRYRYPGLAFFLIRGGTPNSAADAGQIQPRGAAGGLPGPLSGFVSLPIAPPSQT